MKIKKSVVPFFLALFCIAALSHKTHAELVARQITMDTTGTDLFLGTDAVGGVGDWFLSNGTVQAIIDNVGFQEDIPSASLPITNGVAPSGGTVIDLGLVGKNNDQLNQIFHLANFNVTTPIIYGPPVFADVDSAEGVARLTVSGFVFFPPISTPENPTLPVQTEYSVRTGENFLRIKTTITNGSGGPVELFSIADVMVLGGNSNLPFAVSPGRGFNHPELDLTDPLSAAGVFPYISVIGRVTPDDGMIDTLARVPADEVSYTILSPPGLLFGLNDDQVSATGNVPTDQPLEFGESLIYERRIIVGDRNDVASSADFAITQLSEAFGFPIRRVRGQVFAPVDLPFRASVEITQTSLNPITCEPGTLRSDLIGDLSPLPLTQILTDSARNGDFETILPVGCYVLQVTAEERNGLGPIEFRVLPISDASDTPIVLNSIELPAAAKLKIAVLPPGPAKITFKGRDGTPDPNFGLPVNFMVGGELERIGDDVSSPAANFALTATGEVETTIRSGTYEVFASRGIEHAVDSKLVNIGEGETQQVRLIVRRAITTPGFLSADLHIHSARSSDSSAPLRDRVISYAAEGVEVMVSSDHDFILNYQPVIEELGLTHHITSMTGNEVTTTLTRFFQNDIDTADPLSGFGIGHFNGWPLQVIPEARRDGAPEDEFVEPNIIYDRLRSLGASIVQLNHPESPGIGFLEIIGFDADKPITEPPNSFLLKEAITGSGTRNIDFDTIEIFNGPSIPDYLLSRQDWFNLLNQGILKAATAVSDSHRVVVDHAGFPRTYVESRTRDLRHFGPEEFNDNLKAMKAIGTSGPFLTVRAIGAKAFSLTGEPSKGVSDIGRLVRPLRSGNLRFLVIVRAAPWIPVEEIRIFANGQLVESIPVTPTTSPIRFVDLITLPNLTQDTYFVLEAGQVLPEDPTQQPPSLALMGIVEPGVASLAFTNPIFVDWDGNGEFNPPGIMPPAIDQAYLRQSLRDATPVERYYWQEFWSKMQMRPEQARRVLEKLSKEGKRRLPDHRPR